MLSVQFLRVRDLFSRPHAEEGKVTWSIQVQGGSSRCVHLDRAPEKQDNIQVGTLIGAIPSSRFVYRVLLRGTSINDQLVCLVQTQHAAPQREERAKGTWLWPFRVQVVVLRQRSQRKRLCLLACHVQLDSRRTEGHQQSST